MKPRVYVVLFLVLLFSTVNFVYAGETIDNITVRPPFHILNPIVRPGTTASGPQGLDPSTIRAVYQLPSTGGTGTIAIIDAYDDASVINDFNVFSLQYGLPTATASNFEIHKMSPTLGSATISSWDLEISLDVEWAHVIAPNAKILLVEAENNSIAKIIEAVDYVNTRPDVVVVSMSLGSGEFAGETTMDYHFINPYGATFFAASGDYGTLVEFPAVSPNVVGVGGTVLTIGVTTTETAWVGSGGGLSIYESEPSYQITYSVKSANGFRAVPDVSYDAGSGVPVYDTLGFSGWLPNPVGGTSAGAPQWAAIRALGKSAFINNAYFYQIAASPVSYANNFRDITTGSNGTTGFFTTATTNYDYVTGLGSPLGTGLLVTGVPNWTQQNYDNDFTLFNK